MGVRHVLVALALVLAAGIAILAGLRYMTAMPGPARPPPARYDAAQLADLQDRLGRHVRHLAGIIGVRHRDAGDSLARSARYIAARFHEAGFVVRRERFGEGGREFENVEASIPGRDPAGGIIVIGAHYDTVSISPGADDNASGVAVLIELARQLNSSRPAHGLRFIAFANEEHPFFLTGNMGALAHARRARERQENILAMLSLEALGYFDGRARSQRYPRPLSWFYPDTADFVGFVGNLRSRALVREAIATFRASARVPSEGFTAPEKLFPDVARSDHAAFWRYGYRAFMITDTAGFRFPFYHTALDTPDGLDYRRMARLTLGVRAIIERLAETDVAGMRTDDDR